MPGFLERDEGEREPPYDKYPVGRRQRRAAVPRASRRRRRSACTRASGRTCNEDSVRTFRHRSADHVDEHMLNIPVLRWGQPYD